jgi:hypothetical protein
MAVANTLAYYVTATIMAVKSFIVQAPSHTDPALDFYANRQKMAGAMNK